MDDYVKDRKGRPHHKCDGVGEFDDIHVQPDGEWVLTLDSGDSKVVIKYCPWCGKELTI